MGGGLGKARQAWGCRSHRHAAARPGGRQPRPAGGQCAERGARPGRPAKGPSLALIRAARLPSPPMSRFWHGFADMHTVADNELVIVDGEGAVIRDANVKVE